MRILVIQTAFIGDAILATAMLEALHDQDEVSSISLLVRKGNESLFKEHPFLDRLHILDKSRSKLRQLFSMTREIRKARYDVVVNLQRFMATGILTALSGASTRIGFNKNPMSWAFTHSIQHIIGDGRHEVERNMDLLVPLFGRQSAQPRLYPSNEDYQKIERKDRYVCMAPSSVWFTKQWPKENWVELVKQMPKGITIILLGGKADKSLCDEIGEASETTAIENHCGSLNLLQSAALMEGALMNYVNDSAPLHLCSSLNAPVTAFFCSTVPSFGFGPLSDSSKIVETDEELECRPCGLHGKKACPLGHFKCANSKVDQDELALLTEKADS